MFADDEIHLWAALTGSVLQEVFWWYGRRWSPVIQTNLLSYTIITLIFIAAATLGTIFFLAEETTSPKVHLLTAFGFPLILKRSFKLVVDERARSKQEHAGGAQTREFVRRYFD